VTPIAAAGGVPLGMGGDHSVTLAELRAEMDCFVVVSACPQDIVAINNNDPTPVAIELLD
jgi:uncharacterized protein